MQLRISRDITLPPDAATQTTLIVGKRGSGKSSTARRLVEQLHRIHVPFVVLDPVDTWWGLRASRSGGTGLEGVYVFGGRRQDLPLEAAGGTLIAETVCENRISAVLSVKHLSGRARGTFMADFARTLFQRWAAGVIHLVLELAALQGLVEPGEDLVLDGASDSAWRERIGNAVPSPAAAAIASVMGTTLLLAWSGETFALSATPIWVRPLAIALSVAQQEPA